VRTAHRVLHRWSAKPYLYAPRFGRVMHKPVGWLERRYGRPLRVCAHGGVVLAAGGFVANKAMLREHAPASRGGLPLGTPGDDGGGILLGVAAGGAAAHLDRVSLWRFLSPPPALIHGILVDQAGLRVDAATLAEARGQVAGSTLWFQRLQARYLLTRGRQQGATLAEVARRAGVDPAGLEATVAEHNAAAANGKPDPAGKPAAQVRAQSQPPFSLIDCSVRPSVANPVPVLTLGGLVVDEKTGQVRRADGAGVPGLYAAGRNAVGLCSRSYVSGLSLADCVFSGRRAGRNAAGQG
jgi:3-oxo-5alpha-steroid 4-dehydrogenase